MLKPLKTFILLTRQDRNLVLRAATALVVCWARLRVQGIKEIQAWAARPGSGTVEAKRLAWAVETASRRAPGTTCLSKALALQHLLSANGRGSELMIGVDNSQGRFSAHAWLVVDGEILIGGCSVENHQTLATWSTTVASREADQPKQG
jgi:hypothetical protein